MPWHYFVVLAVILLAVMWVYRFGAGSPADAESDAENPDPAA